MLAPRDSSHSQAKDHLNNFIPPINFNLLVREGITSFKHSDLTATAVARAFPSRSWSKIQNLLTAKKGHKVPLYHR